MCSYRSYLLPSCKWNHFRFYEDYRIFPMTALIFLHLNFRIPLWWFFYWKLERICSYPKMREGFPGGSDSKESACNAGDLGSIPGLGRSSGEENGNLLQYSGLEKSMDRGAWQVAVHGVTESWTQLSDFHFFTFGCKEGRVPKNWCLWTVVLEKTPESPLDSKEIKSVNLKGNQLWNHWEDWWWKLQHFGLMWKADSLEKSSMMGKTE